jgi:serine/threonine protein phosphatase PrpC
MRFSSASISKPGGREENQDFYDSVQTDTAGLWLLADGLGGHRGGEVASATAVQAIRADWQPAAELVPETVMELIETAQAAILDSQKAQPSLASMRTTLVLLQNAGDKVIWGHVGDSRLYHFRDCAVAFQTKDHSVPQVLVDAGEIDLLQMRKHPDRNRILRAVGNPEGVKPTILDAPRSVKAGDTFLLCSDGFWEYVTELEMSADLAKSATAADWLQRMELRLLERAETGHDNYTALAVFVGE